jgi:hypothetical protein
LFLINSLVVGLTAMSIIQIARRIFRIRGAYHREVVGRWLGEQASAELSSRAQAGQISAMFDLPTEMLTGQLSAIAEQALERRGWPSPLVRRMAEGGEPTPSQWESSHADEAESDHDTRASLALAIQRNLDQFQISTSAAWRRYLWLTAVLLSLVLFNAGLQLFNTGSFIPGLKAYPRVFNEWLGNFAALSSAAILVGLFGGFLATIGRDIVAIIEKLRR